MDVLIETRSLGNGVTAPVIQLGAVAFEPASGGKVYNSKGFHTYVTPAEGYIDPAFLRTFMNHRGFVYDPDETAVDEATALSKLEHWLTLQGWKWADVERVWLPSTATRLPSLAGMYRRTGARLPFDITALVCAESVFRFKNPEWVKKDLFEPGDNAFADAVAYACSIQSQFMKG